MSHLHELIATRVAEWRDARYQHDAWPAISEILDYQTDLDASGPASCARYELPAPKSKTTMAVKIIDMLGEEVIVTARLSVMAAWK